MKLNQWIALGIAGCAVVLYYLIGGNAMMCLLARIIGARHYKVFINK